MPSAAPTSAATRTRGMRTSQITMASVSSAVDGEGDVDGDGEVDGDSADGDAGLMPAAITWSTRDGLIDVLPIAMPSTIAPASTATNSAKNSGTRPASIQRRGLAVMAMVVWRRP